MTQEDQQTEKTMWYYQKNNQQSGPVDATEIERLIQDGDLTGDTKVWTEGMAEWEPAMSTEFGGMFPQNEPPPASPPEQGPAPVPPPADPAPVQPVDDVKRLNTWFMVFWICLAAGIPLSIVFIGLGGVIASFVFYCFILHRLWSLIPVAKAQTTPGKAVGFLFIPFFNFYWNFVAYHGLAKAINIETRQAGIPGKEVNEGLTLTYCILICCSIIPYLGVLACIGGIVIWIISLKQLKDAGIALIENQKA